MKERLISVFEEVLAVNKGGKVRNLLITDDSPEFLDDGLYTLRRWAFDRRFHLVELDEKSGDWLNEVQSRELFDKLNTPDTVLLVKNYARTLWKKFDTNTPRNFLRDAALNRHYGCGNDFVPADELPNLLFVVALNDLSPMHWEEVEFSCFEIMHKDESKTVWSNTRVHSLGAQMHPVMSRENKELYRASADGKDLSFEVNKAFRGLFYRPYRTDDTMRMREDRIHLFFEKNRPDFYEQVENLILKGHFSREDDEYKLDAARLLAVFPRLKTICCPHNIVIENVPHTLRVFDPFELGEYSFELARAKDFKEANRYSRMLWALDSKWAKFWNEVAVDFSCPHERHESCYPDGNISNTGLDKLFRVYLLGWYSPTDQFEYYEQLVFAKKHQNVDKAIELLQARFKNREIHEITKKLMRDLEYVEVFKEDYEQMAEENGEDLDEEFDGKQDYSGFMRALIATDHLYPGTMDQLYDEGIIGRLLG